MPHLLNATTAIALALWLTECAASQDAKLSDHLGALQKATQAAERKQHFELALAAGEAGRGLIWPEA